MKKLAVANGSYVKDGVQKTSWVNVGVIGTSQAGKEYCLIDPTINFAGFPREEGKDMVMVGIFDDSQRGQTPQGQPAYGQPPAQPPAYGQPLAQPNYGGQTPPAQNNPPVEYYDANGQPLPPR